MTHEVTLRLSNHHYARLLERAGPEGPAEAAGELLRQALEGDALAAQVGAHYQQFEAQVRDLRRDLATSTSGLLVALGRVPPEDARRWAEQNLG